MRDRCGRNVRVPPRPRRSALRCQPLTLPDTIVGRDLRYNQRMFRLASFLALMTAATAGCADDSDAPAIDRVDDATVAECAHGGVVVRSGDDRDRDGVLDDDEVTGATPVCDDRPPRVLTRVDTVAPGAACERGGSIIRSGVDLDGDEVLDDGEVASTETVCAPVVSSDRLIEGSVTIQHANDVARLRGIHVITGDLIVEDTWSLPNVVVPDVRYIGGSVVIRNRRDGRVDLSAVTRIVGDVSLDPTARISELRLPALESVSGSLLVQSAPSLATISVPVLARVDGGVRIDSCPVLTSLGLPALTRIGGELFVAWNEALRAVDAPLLSSIGDDATLSYNPAMARLDLAALRSAHIIWIAHVALTELALHADARLDIHGVRSLTKATLRCGWRLDLLDAPVLTEVALDCTARDDSDVRLYLAAATSVTVVARSLANLHVGAPRLAILSLRHPDGSTVSVTRASIEAPITHVPLVATESLSLARTQLREVACERLDSLTLKANPVLERVACTRISDLHARDNPMLESIDLSELTSGGRPLPWKRLWIENNPRLTHAPLFDQLDAVEDLVVDASPLLPLPATMSIHGCDVGFRDVRAPQSLDVACGTGNPTLWLERTAVTDLRFAMDDATYDFYNLRLVENSQLVSAEVTGVIRTVQNLAIERNPVLRTLRMAPMDATAARIVDNRALPWCVAQEILDGFEGRTEVQSGNDEDAAECTRAP